MGLLVEGQWVDKWYDTKSSGGRFVRTTTTFREAISAAEGAEFPAQAGRYHLFVAMACPWAHRTLLYRSLKGLKGLIDISVVEPDMLDKGWAFSSTHPDRLFGYDYAHQLYTRADPKYTGRVTVPIVWDKAADRLVNNESAEIIRFLDSEFEALADPSAPFAHTRLAPEALLPQIDEINDFVYHRVNNGVYKAGFATTQEAYEEAVVQLFEALDTLEERLSRTPYLLGDQITEADWRLFPTLLRFDPVYHAHFKCSLKRLQDYPNLWDYTRALFQTPGVADTFNLEETRRHYFYSHESINPHRVVPVAPEMDLMAPTKRPVPGL